MSLQTNKLSAAEDLDELAYQIGEFIKYWGFKRIHGQIWTHLYLSNNPLDAGQLIRRLGVSKALISMSLSDLLSYDVIKRAGKSSSGTQLYEANRQVVEVILRVLEQREFALITRIRDAHARLEMMPPEEKLRGNLNPKQISSLGKLISTAEKCLGGILKLGTIDCSMWKKMNGS